MVMTRAGVTAVLARATRHRALLRRTQAYLLSASYDSSPLAATRSLGWCATSLQSTGFAGFSTKSAEHNKKLASLVIAEAFEDDGLDEDDDNDGVNGGNAPDEDGDLSFGYDMDEHDAAPTATAPIEDEDESASTLSTDEKRELAKRLRFAMDKKKQWMLRLAETGEFDTLVRVVYECYEPLYATDPRLVDTPCALWKSYSDAAAVASAKTRYTPKWYDDTVTKITEQEAMALFVNSHRPELALAVFHHREWLASTIGSVTIQAAANDEDGHGPGSVMDDVTVDLTKHFRSYYSWAMGACAELGDHARAFSIYENALEDGVFPTANMTLTYLNSLIAKREFEAIEALYEQIQKDDRPMNLYFYRQMLFFVRLTNNSKIMKQVLDEMKIKGYKVRSEDYLNAIRALDLQYFRRAPTSRDQQTGKPKTGRTSLFVDESYRECVDRIAEQEASPDLYASLEAVCGQVIKMFEEMIEDEQVAPKNEQFFPRVMAAALFLQDLDRVAEYVELYERCFSKPLTDATAVKIATNALLIRGEPVAAWELVIKASEATTGRGGRAKGKPAKFNNDPSPVEAMSNVVEYLVSTTDTELLLQLLEMLDKRKLLGMAIRHDQRGRLMDALVADTTTLNDTDLWKTVNQKYWRVFPVRTKATVLEAFVQACVAADRWPLAAKALHTRNREMIPSLPPRLAVLLSERALEDTSDPERVELVAQLPKMVDFRALDSEQCRTFVCNAIRALNALKDDAKTGRTQHRRREISRLHDMYLRGKQPVPADIREIMLQML